MLPANGAYASGSVNRTMLGLSAATTTPRNASANGPAYALSCSSPTVYRTSSAVTGAPSCQLASGRIVNVQIFPVWSTS